MIAFPVLAGWALPRLVRGVHGGLSGMAKHMVPSVERLNRLGRFGASTIERIRSAARG